MDEEKAREVSKKITESRENTKAWVVKLKHKVERPRGWLELEVGVVDVRDHQGSPIPNSFIQ